MLRQDTTPKTWNNILRNLNFNPEFSHKKLEKWKKYVCNPWFKQWFYTSLQSQLMQCVCQNIRSMFRVLGINNFGSQTTAFKAINPIHY